MPCSLPRTIYTCWIGKIFIISFLTRSSVTLIIVDTFLGTSLARFSSKVPLYFLWSFFPYVIREPEFSMEQLIEKNIPDKIANSAYTLANGIFPMPNIICYVVVYFASILLYPLTNWIFILFSLLVDWISQYSWRWMGPAKAMIGPWWFWQIHFSVGLGVSKNQFFPLRDNAVRHCGG